SIPKLKTDESGPLLITHWGLSGQAILKISAWKARELEEMKYQFKIKVNFLGIESEEAAEIFTQYRQQNPKKTIGASKIIDVTTRFWHRILWLSKINLDKNISTLTSKEVQNMLGGLCANEMK